MISKAFSLVRKHPFITLFVVVVLVAAVGYFAVRPQRYVSSKNVLILSPHYDDAVLSLGGLMNQVKGKVTVVTFFTGKPERATSTPWDTKSGFKDSTEAMTARVEENNKAMMILGVKQFNLDYLDFQYSSSTRAANMAQIEQDLAKDIQAAIASYGTQEVDVYGPSIFTKDITHPDHELLHRAYLDVVSAYPNKEIHFYFYEDFPYVQGFSRESLHSLQKNLEDDSGLLMNPRQIPLSKYDVSRKLKALKEYSSQGEAFSSQNFNIASQVEKFTMSRCGPKGACEAVYEIMRF